MAVTCICAACGFQMCFILLLLSTSISAQATINAELSQGICNASLLIKNCALDRKNPLYERESWPPGLSMDTSEPFFGQTEDHSLFADNLAYLIHQIFRDADRKEPHLYDLNSPGDCFFPLLYYICTSNYHSCVQDVNVTVRVEQEAAFLPNPSSEHSSNELNQSNSGFVLQPLVVPRYPCFSFCNDSQVQECKNQLVLALNVSLGGSPLLDYYLGNITDWFNCTRLNAKSAYSRDEKREVCLARPGAPRPPSSPPPPLSPPASSSYQLSKATRKDDLGFSLILLMATPSVMTVTLQLRHNL